MALMLSSGRPHGRRRGLFATDDETVFDHLVFLVMDLNTDSDLPRTIVVLHPAIDAEKEGSFTISPA